MVSRLERAINRPTTNRPSIQGRYTIGHASNAASNSSGNIRSHRTSLCFIQYPFPIIRVFHPVSVDALRHNYRLQHRRKRIPVHLLQPAAVQFDADRRVQDRA